MATHSRFAADETGSVATAPPDPIGPEVRLLGPVEVAGTDGPLTGQRLALVSFLACVGSAGRDTIVDALWDGRPISPGRFANLVSETRAGLGPDRLPAARSGRYRLVGVTTDLDRLELALRPRGSPAPTGRLEPRSGDRLTELEMAFALVRGPLMATPPTRSWRWLDAHPEITSRAELLVTATAGELIRLLVDRGRLAQASEVCERALACCPLERPLVEALTLVYRRQGRPMAAARLQRQWQRRVDRLDGDLLAQASSGTAVTTTLPR